MAILKNAIKLSMILLTGLSLSSCRTYEVDYHYSIDLKNMRCLKYPLVDKENLKYLEAQVVPLMECDGMFGVSAKDTGYTLTFIREEKARCEQPK